MNVKILDDIYNAFDPFRPLPPGDPFYVDCHAVRGNDNILSELGKKIERSNKPTCQIYTGHRGVGKSTELLRLRADLESKGIKVVYFAADDDIDEEDAQYTDVLLSCVRHILENLQNQANPSPLTNWLKSRWRSLTDLALTEIKFEDLKVEQQVSQFAKLTATLRQVPSTRQKIREQIDIHSISLIEALNEFITEATQKFATKKLVVIADNLDRIVPSPRGEGRTNHDEIFIDRSGQLRRLNCHVIYTVPISLVYSNQASPLRDNYGNCQVLPMLMLRQRDGSIYAPGLEKFKELISRRVQQFDASLDLETQVFDNAQTLEHLCLMSGGHMREIMQLMQSAMDWIDVLPLSFSAVRQAIVRNRIQFQQTVDDLHWARLAEVSKTKQIPNDGDYRRLLFSRCLLEYGYVNGNGEMQRWHDVHPLLKESSQFQAALAKLNL